MELGKDVPGPPLNDLTGSKGIVIVYRLRAVPKLRTEVSKSATAFYQGRRERPGRVEILERRYQYWYRIKFKLNTKHTVF